MKSRKDRDVRELTNRERRMREKKGTRPAILTIMPCHQSSISSITFFFPTVSLSREGGIHTASTGEVVAPKSSVDLLLARTALAVHNKCDLHELVHLNL